jgi:threonine aldolase
MSKTSSTESHVVNGVNGHSKHNAWAGPGAAAFDFRSMFMSINGSGHDSQLIFISGDTITTPTASMLQAIHNTTLFDDVYEEDTTTISLEADMAALCHHEAGLFVLSGTMGNQLALRAHLKQPPHSVLCDYRAHILQYEAGGIATLSGAMVHGIVPKNGVYLTLEDIEEHVIISDNVHYCPTKVISLENTLRGTVIPLEEVRRISGFAKQHDIKLHLDGARIWEVAVSGAGSVSDYTSLCDSASLCFSKGLGAPIGSILVGNKEVIKHARWMRKSIGGGLRQTGVLTAAARNAVDVTFGQGPNGDGNLLKKTHLTAQRIANFWTGLGGELEVPVQTNMVWLDLKKAGINPQQFQDLGEEKGLKLGAGRIVVHYQIGDEAVEKLQEVMTELKKK